ncbi:MAG: hypothetical protein LBO66_12420 [Deltaproteobacteria bacterium]|jgi:hypothetical protein|nr:hypothetical protein [Deltaproteobacteria bacterium]
MADKERKNRENRSAEETISELISILYGILTNPDSLKRFSHPILLQYFDILFEFDEVFSNAAANPNLPLSLTDIEGLVVNYIERHKSLAQELAWEKVKTIDQTPFIDKKKENLLKKT